MTVNPAPCGVWFQGSEREGRCALQHGHNGKHSGGRERGKSGPWPLQEAKVSSAAANTATPGVGGTNICPDCYHPHPDFRFIHGTRTVKHSYQLHERIRALEAEVKRSEWILDVQIARAEKAEAEVAEMKELPPETCPTCGDVLHSGPCREFDSENQEDWDELPRPVRERYEKAEAELAAVRKAEKEWHRDEEQLREELKARAEKVEAEVEGLKELFGLVKLNIGREVVK